MEEQLKRALVRALPDKLGIDTDFHNAAYWKSQVNECSYYVTPHEWPAIVQLVEDNLTYEQRKKYPALVWRNENVQHLISTLPAEVRAVCIFAKWPVRAQALADIGAIEIKED